MPCVILYRKGSDNLKDTTLLQKIGVLNDSIDINDTVLGRTHKFPLMFSDRLKDYFDCIDGTSSGGDGLVKAMYIFTENLASYWNTTPVNNVYINKQLVIQTIAKYIGEEKAEELIDIIRYISIRVSFPPSTKVYKSVLYSKKVVTLVEVLAFTVMAIMLVTPAEYIENWETIHGKNLLDYTKESMTMNLTIKNTEVIAAGRLSFLPEEEKKNIIGSFWNCIIDILEHSYANEVKGGEEDE